MHLDGAAPATGNTAYGDAVVVRIGNVAAQRVLPHPAGGQQQVQVRAGMPRWQPVPVGRGQHEARHVLILGFDPAVLDHQFQRAVDVILRWLLENQQCADGPDRDRKQRGAQCDGG
ncbi:Uncharacterised protein [Mycobacteroides abscessus]|nr:Uncharacterised protein [Mycobacteroides abscessus]